MCKGRKSEPGNCLQLPYIWKKPWDVESVWTERRGVFLASEEETTMARQCPKCGKEMEKVGEYWVCGNHRPLVSVPIETVPPPSAHPFSDLCAVLPTPIAFVLDEFFREVNPFVALWRMVDAAEIITRFFTITVLSDILRQKNEFPEAVQDALTDKLERPTFGAWKELLCYRD
jgi:hypothetical protein